MRPLPKRDIVDELSPIPEADIIQPFIHRHMPIKLPLDGTARCVCCIHKCDARHHAKIDADGNANLREKWTRPSGSTPIVPYGSMCLIPYAPISQCLSLK